MSFLKTKIFPGLRRAKNACRFWLFGKKKNKSQIDIDKNLVYSLSPRKIPNSKQLKHLGRFLNKKELFLIKILVLIFVLSLSYFLFSVVKDKFVYLPAFGGTYTEALVGYPKNINPLYSSGNDADKDLSRLVYSSILKYNKEGDLIPDLAERFSVSEDGKEYYFKIREDVFWHDGSKLTVNDIVFTFNLILNPDYRATIRQNFVGISIEKIDDYSFKFILPEPYSPFLDLLTFGIMPTDLWSGYNQDSIILSDLNLKPVGSGPFKFKSLLKNKNGEIKEYLLEANENYYGGKPYLKNIKFIFLVDRQEAISALNNKQVMGINYLPFSSRTELLAQNSLSINNLIQPQVVALFFNSEKNSFLADKENRSWLEKSIDKEFLNNEIFLNSFRAANTFYLQESKVYNDNFSWPNYSPDEAKEFFHNKFKKSLNENEAENNEEVEDIKLELTVVGSGNNEVVAQKIKDYFSVLGINLEIKVISGEQAANLIGNRDFEILLYGQAVGGDPDVFAFWHSSQIANKGLNLSAFKNTEVDKLLIEARVEIDNEKRNQKYKEIQAIISLETPAIFLYHPSYTYVQSRDLKGFSGGVLIDSADRFSDVTNWHLKTKIRLSK